MDQIYFFLIVFFSALFSTAFFAFKIIPKLKIAKIVGEDMHKKGKPQVSEMGGISIVVGFIGAALVGIIMYTFFGFVFELSGILAALLTVAIVAIIGIYDDLFNISQKVKAALPLAASVPLIAIAIAAGNNSISIPFFGLIDFGLFYPLLLIPVAVAVCSNLTNMLAGFNGLEAGLGIVIFAALSILAFLNGQIEMAVLCIAMLGALIGFIPFNWYPAKLFIGDVGAVSIGAALAAAVIFSNLKSAGAILMVLFVLDFLIKLLNGFPKTFAELKDGKLYPKKGEIRGLTDLILKMFGGLSERNLVVVLIGIQIIIAIIVLYMYGKF
ncbi:MAG: hypothetical protein ABIH83_00865 [Candidatus Micrarchaeota archaeon]